MTLLNLIKQKLGITQIEQDIIHIKQFVNEFKKHTRVDADVGFRSNNTIILTGVYRNKAYVHFYDLGDGEFLSLVEQLKNMKKYAYIRNIDAPIPFKGMFIMDEDV